VADPFDAPGGNREVERDRYGRPLVAPADGGKAKAYTRCTTYVSALEDTYNLGLWQQRMVALGLADRPDLLLAVSAHRDDKDRLNKICDDAREAAKASAAATTGTALHSLVERMDRGLPLGAVPAAYAADLKAYERATSVLEHVHIEELMVLDELKIAGTPDRLALHEERLKVADVKTGSIEWGAGKIAMQLAVYAHSKLYHPATGARTELDIDTGEAIVVHLPAGQGRCELHRIDIAAGWEAVQLARQVRAWRARKGLLTPLRTAPPEAADEISAAASVDELNAVWARHQAAWTDELTALAAARKSELTGAAS
jgi:hypothetical protein